MNSLKNNRIAIPIITILAGYIIVALFFSIVLKYNFLQSDVQSYWQDSLNWQAPFHSFHVPGYSLLIALLRGVTFNVLHPLAIMWAINLTAFSISFFLIHNIILTFSQKAEVAILGAMLFGLWPLVGLTYTVIPLADLLAICFFLLGLYYLLITKMLPAGVFFGLSMITHKAIWLFVFVLILFDMVRRKDFFSKNTALLIVPTLLPLFLLWILGASYHHSLTWLISSNVTTEFASQSTFPIMDGLLGTLLEGGTKGLIKGALLLGFVAICFLALGTNIHSTSKFRLLGIGISLSVLAYFLILNQHEIWAAVRFSRLLVLPLAIGLPAVLANHFGDRKYQTGIVAGLVLLFASQLAYAWYVAKVFFA